MAANNVYPAIALTGGTSGALDNIDGNILQNNDIAIVISGSAAYLYHLNSTSGVAESSPDIIAPDDSPGNKRWELVDVQGLKGVFNQVNWAKGADVASANALSLGEGGNYFDITGITSITSIGTLGIGTMVCLHFDGALTFTRHATDLILPGGANITTEAGDEAILIEYASGDWRCINYTRASFVTAFTDIKQDATDALTGVVELATGAEAVTGVDTTRAVTPDALTDRMAAPGEIGGTTPAKINYTIPVGSHDDITATSDGIAASVATETTFVTTNGDSDLDNVTLADGTEGQTKHILCVVEGNAADTWKITPANMVGGTQITFAGVGEGCILKMYSAGWGVIGNHGGTVS